MKAKDYYKKYGERLADPETSNEALWELMKDMASEQEEIIKKRTNNSGTLSNKACMAILNEMNDKWNAIAGMFPTEVLRRNGWKNYFMKCLEEHDDRKRST